MTGSESAALASPQSAGRTRPSARAVEANKRLYQVAFDEGERTLQDQAAELNNARGRAVSFLTLVLSATGFLLAHGVTTGETRDWVFYTISGMASAFSAADMFAVGWLLWPKGFGLYNRVYSGVLVRDWIERDVPAQITEADMLRELALRMDSWRIANTVVLGRTRRLYFWSIILGGIQLILWAALVWARG